MHHTYIGLLHDANIYFNCFFIQKRVHKTYSKIRKRASSQFINAMFGSKKKMQSKENKINKQIKKKENCEKNKNMNSMLMNYF